MNCISLELFLPVDGGNLRFRDIQTRDGMTAELVCVRAMQLPKMTNDNFKNST